MRAHSPPPLATLRRRLREPGDHVATALDVALDLDDVVALRVLEEIAERVVAVVLLVEGRLLALRRTRSAAGSRGRGSASIHTHCGEVFDAGLCGVCSV